MPNYLARHAVAQDHDIWFRAELEAALRKVDAPAVPRIASEYVAADWRRKLTEILKVVD